MYELLAHDFWSKVKVTAADTLKPLIFSQCLVDHTLDLDGRLVNMRYSYAVVIGYYAIHSKTSYLFKLLSH